jgi:hypothetical protein
MVAGITRIQYNTNTNFGGLLIRGKENVLTKIKSQLNRRIIVSGCNANIFHNCAKTAFDSMPVDIEVLVTKICGYFHVTYGSCRTPRRSLWIRIRVQEDTRLCKYNVVAIISSLGKNTENLSFIENLFFFMSETQCRKVLKRLLKTVGQSQLSCAHSQSSLSHDTKWGKVMTSAQQNHH